LAEVATDQIFLKDLPDKKVIIIFCGTKYNGDFLDLLLIQITLR